MKLTALLVMAVLLSALAVVYAKHRARMVFAETQRLEQEKELLQTEWGQLLLEQNLWGEHSRIERVARNRLSMELPARKSIVYLNDHVRR